MNARTAAFALGIIFIIVGVLGFIPNPIVGPAGIFVTNPMHNYVHIISGIVLLIGVYTALTPGLALKIIGVVYAIVAILGFVLPMPDGMMLGMIKMGPPVLYDNILHVVLAIVILAAGFGLPAIARPATV